jgi:hypothetical protein
MGNKRKTRNLRKLRHLKNLRKKSRKNKRTKRMRAGGVLMRRMAEKVGIVKPKVLEAMWIVKPKVDLQDMEDTYFDNIKIGDIITDETGAHDVGQIFGIFSSSVPHESQPEKKIGKYLSLSRPSFPNLKDFGKGENLIDWISENMDMRDDDVKNELRDFLNKENKKDPEILNSDRFIIVVNLDTRSFEIYNDLQFNVMTKKLNKKSDITPASV